MIDTFAQLASDNDLEDRLGRSPEGLTERYLYSSDMVFRYAFGRWWGNTDLATSAIWVLLNPATGDTERRHRPTLERCISASRAAGHTGLVIVNLFAFRDTDPRNLLVPWVPPRPASSAEDGVNHHVTAAALLPHPPVVARDTVGALFDREPVQFSLRGDTYLWRELRAQFATTPLPSDWYELRQLLQGGVDKVVGDLLASRESLGWHDPDAAVYVPAYDPGHGISAGAVHLPWWSHTGIPILLDRFQAQRLPEGAAEAD